jgi:hypothetical protein
MIQDRTTFPTDLRLRHGNGFEEEICGGRYEMRDNRGRGIVPGSGPFTGNREAVSPKTGGRPEPRSAIFPQFSKFT